jgi:DNA-binding response OmpR family regulator
MDPGKPGFRGDGEGTAFPSWREKLARILLVEGEPALVETLTHYLKHQGYEVLTANSGPRGLDLVRQSNPSIVVLDVILPDMDGFELCRLMRRESSVPILMISALDSESDKVLGLEMGADDYLTKPFSMRELASRVRALLRRVELCREHQPVCCPLAGEKPILGSRDLVVNLDRREARLGDSLLRLKPKEYELLVFFLRHRGEELPRETLIQGVWGNDRLNGSRTIDVHVRWLRKKIEEDPSHPVRRLTLKNIGYKFEG